jgi:hypothetical protein
MGQLKGFTLGASWFIISNFAISARRTELKESHNG